MIDVLCFSVRLLQGGVQLGEGGVAVHLQLHHLHVHPGDAAAEVCSSVHGAVRVKGENKNIVKI